MNLQNFMKVFMYALELYLNEHKDELAKVQYQSDEANTDRPLKEFLKNKIENECKKVPPILYSSFLIVEEASQKSRISIKAFEGCFIEKVYLPDEISASLKAVLSKQKGCAIYTNPDILLRINIHGSILYESVELKSTKNDSIPGSSIQQIDPKEWVIFVKHNGDNVDITTGQYLHAVNAKLQFPDRSPRPQVSFAELKKWNSQNRIISDQIIEYLPDSEDTIKDRLLNNWQEVLSSRWVDLLFNSKTVRVNEPWFNNNMRIFILDFLKRYDALSEQEKQEFKRRTESLIR